MANPVLNKVKYFLSLKGTTVFILLLAMVARLIQLVFFYNIRVDLSYQIMASQNLLEGHGVSYATIRPEDLSTTIYEPLINWPPGYSYLFAPFYILSGHDYVAAGMALSIVSGIALIFISRELLKLFDLPLYLLNIYTLTTGFFVYYFYFISSSDAVAITMFTGALYYAVRILKTESAVAVSTFMMTTLLLACAFTKYLFMPVAFILPVFLILKGFTKGRQKIKWPGVYSFLILALGTAALILYQKHTSGSGVYISEPRRGFFPENLQAAYPFLPASLIKPDSLTLLFPLPEVFFFQLYQLIYILSIGFACICFLWAYRKYGIKKTGLAGSFFYLTFLISFCVALTLAVLSLVVAKDAEMWTYIQEPRYYGLPNVLVHLAVFVFYRFVHLKFFRYPRYLFCGLLLLLLPEMFRGMVFTAKRIAAFGKEEYSWQYELRFQKYAADLIRTEQRKHPGMQAVLTGSSYYFNNRVSIYSHIPIFSEVVRINKMQDLHTKAPVLLIVILFEKHLPNFRSFLSEEGHPAIGKFDGFLFYSVPIRPE
jgi:hypothetical protein